MENNLPESWELIKLVEDLNFIPTGIEEFNGTKKYYSTGSIQENEFTPEGEFTFKNRPSRANRVAELGDVFQARMKATDKGILIDEKLNGQLFSTGFFQLRPYGDTYSNKLLYYLVKSDLFLKQKNDLATGSTQEALTDNGASDIEIPLPPLAEQHRIVAKLDAIMQKVESNKQRLDKIPKILKRFRQSVLAAAVNGKLTEDWREKNKDVESAEQLLIRLKEERPSGRLRKLAEIEHTNETELPGTWKWCQLDEITLLVTDGKHGDCNDERDSGYYFLSAKDISNGTLNYNNARQIVYREFLETHRRTNLEPGDICVVNTGATVGKSAIAKNDKLTSNTTFQKSVAVIKFFKNSIESKYIDYIIQIETPKILKKSGGSAINNWLLSEMRAFWCQLPPSMEQKEIVKRVEKLFAFADKLEARYNKAKAMLDKLPQSILAKAFRGELVAQDPNDEPASVLLERIKAEKEKLKAEKQGKKSSKEKVIKKRYRDIISYLIAVNKPVTQAEIFDAVPMEASEFLLKLNQLMNQKIIFKEVINSQPYFGLAK